MEQALSGFRIGHLLYHSFISMTFPGLVRVDKKTSGDFEGAFRNPCSEENVVSSSSLLLCPPFKKVVEI